MLPIWPILKKIVFQKLLRKTMNPPHDSQPSTKPDHAGVAFHPPFLLAFAILTGFLARWLVPLAFLSPSLATSLGLVIIVAAFGVFFWALYTMQTGNASIPTSEPTDAIVIRGPFRFSRNPIYLSMVLLQVGIGVWANSLWFLGLAVVSAVLLWWGVISCEEQYLERKFGTEYMAYKERVRRSL